MKILILGATGFIGRNLTTYLSEKNHEVYIVSRSFDKAKKIFPSKVKTFAWDYIDPIELSEIVDHTEIIINLAGENIASKFWTKNQKNKILNSRIQLGHKITEAIKLSKTKPKLLVQASAVGYYGFNLNEVCDEHCFKGKGFLADVCDTWEKSTEQVILFDVKRIILRTGVVLGVNGGMFPKLVSPIKHYLGSNIGKGENFISWIHIDDVMRAIEFLMDNKYDGIYNLTAPIPIQSKQLNFQIAKKMRRTIWLRIPQFIVQFILGDFAKELLLSNQKVFPNQLLKKGFQFNYENIPDAINSLIKKGRN